MKKKTLIILCLLSAVFSIIYIVLNYYGLIRYTNIYLYSIEHYINNYSKLDEVNKKNKVIITLIVNENQFKNIKYVIKSLLDQTVKVNLISIVLPNNHEFILPDELSKSVAIYKYNDDKIPLGNLNSILSTVIREGEATTKIITLQAGVIYGKDFIEIILEESEKHPNHVIYVNSEENNDIELEKGTLFNTGLFDTHFLNTPNNVNINEYINNYFDKKKIKKHKVIYNQNYKYII